jgi:hypothetical protein
MEILNIEAFLSEQRIVKSKKNEDLFDVSRRIDGEKTTEISLSVKLTRMSDVDDLINFLRMARPSLGYAQVDNNKTNNNG